MIVALDMQLASGTATGIGEYARGLADALSAQGVTVAELAAPNLDPWRFDRRVVWDQLLLPMRARASGAQLLHCASGTMPVRSALPCVVTVHDVAWLKVQSHTRPYARWYFGKFALAQYRRAAAIAVDSEFSKRELLEVLGVPEERVHVVYPGVAADFCAVQRRPGEGRAVLVPGTVERRKNIEVLIRALPQLPGARIVSTGPFTPYKDDCERLAAELGVHDRVEFRGYVERSELLELYATCALVAVPSRYEGFGYAAAQALCSGTPTIVSDQSSLPEVAAGDAPAIPVDDTAAWARAIDNILNDPATAGAHCESVREKSIARFAWPSGAAAMISIYESAR